MLNSAVIDIALGMLLFFLILSLVCSAVQEWIASAVGLRSRNLRQGIENLIGADIAKSLYDHGQLKGLYREPGTLGGLKRISGGGGVGPSYVEPKRFANILIDVIDRGDGQPGGTRQNSVAKTFEEIESSIKTIKDPHIREALLSLLAGAEGKVEIFRDEVADWFDAAMDRVSGWYARTVKVWLFVIATAVVVILNADAIEVGKRLWEDQALRTALASFAAQTAGSEKLPSYDSVVVKLQIIPVGWKCERSNALCVLEKFDGFAGAMQTLIGWLITILACSFGAPFWFGLLNKVVALRGSGRAPPKAAQ